MAATKKPAAKKAAPKKAAAKKQALLRSALAALARASAERELALDVVFYPVIGAPQQALPQLLEPLARLAGAHVAEVALRVIALHVDDDDVREAEAVAMVGRHERLLLVHARRRGPQPGGRDGVRRKRGVDECPAFHMGHDEPVLAERRHQHQLHRH